MTQVLDLADITTDKEIKAEFRDQLETEIKDTLIWALGESSIKDLTRTVRARDPNSLPLYKLYSLFRLHFSPERNKYHSRDDFFEFKREAKDTLMDKTIRDRKDCELEQITAAELITSKFIALIGKFTGDN